MLQDKIAARVEEVPGQDFVREAVQPFQGVGRICEDDIEFLVADGKEVENIGVDGRDGIQAEPGGFAADEGGVLTVHLDTVDPACAARGEFIGDGARAAEKIEYLQVLELVLVVQDVEQALAGKIGRGPRPVAHRGQDGFALEPSADDSHSTTSDLK